MKLHHIGIATEDIASTTAYLETITEIESKSEVVFDPEQNAMLCMLHVRNGNDIELIQGEVVKKLIKKGQYIYHLCYETDDIEAQIQALTDCGGIVVSSPKKAVLFGDRRVAFLMTEIGLMELVEV